MSARKLFVGIAVFGLLGLSSGPVKAGLYDDDKTKITGGDILDIDYWNDKWNYERMDEAIKSHQPEGAIAVEVGSLVRNLDELSQKYPNDTELKKWHDHAAEVEAKIDPNANRSESFRDGCLWREGNYRLAYASYGAGKMAMDAKRWEDAKSWLRMADENLGFLQTRVDKKDRVANWPPEFIEWIKTTRADVQKQRAEVAKHLK